MTEIMQKLSHLLYTQLKKDSPVLSGNMRNQIKITNVNDHSITYEINARYYDMALFDKTGQIVYTNEAWYNYKGQMRKKIIGQTYIKQYNKTTGEPKVGKYTVYQGKKYAKISYANDVNEYGGFFSFNQSRHWVNRACSNAAHIVANEFDANVDNKLPF